MIYNRLNGDNRMGIASASSCVGEGSCGLSDSD